MQSCKQFSNSHFKNRTKVSERKLHKKIRKSWVLEHINNLFFESMTCFDFIIFKKYGHLCNRERNVEDALCFVQAFLRHKSLMRLSLK